ncbi:N-acetyltransferase [candidate division KSB1 bacterium]|nr:N-acetyltransferase [candidate division KSB1 bacterium]
MRIARISDLPRIVEIYNSTIPNRQSTADMEPVTIESREKWFLQHSPDHRPIFVFELNEKVIAWVSFVSFYGRPAYSHTAEISIYIDPQYRHQGIGRKLLTKSIEIAQTLQIKTLVGYIFSHNEPSIRLFRAFGFEEWGHLPNIAEMDGKEYSLSIYGKRIYQ